MARVHPSWLQAWFLHYVSCARNLSMRRMSMCNVIVVTELMRLFLLPEQLSLSKNVCMTNSSLLSFQFAPKWHAAPREYKVCGVWPQLKSLESGERKIHPSKKHQLWRYENIPLLTVGPNLMASAETAMKDVQDFYNQNNQRGLFNLTKKGQLWTNKRDVVVYGCIYCLTVSCTVCCQAEWR